MKFSRAEISDVIIIEPKVFSDERGYFFESFKQNELNEFLGYDVNFCQDNESKSSYGVLRGLHYQEPPFAQSKLVRIIQGSVLDVAVDIRQDSPTFGKHIAIELSEENKRQLFIPKGFAHGFVVLSENAIFSYKVDNYYNGESSQDKRIVLKTTENIYIIYLKDVIRCQSEKNYTYFYFTNRERIIVSKTLKDFEEILSDFGFMRIHRSHLINLKFIDRFEKSEGGFLIMNDGSKVEVSHRKKEALLNYIYGLNNV